MRSLFAKSAGAGQLAKKPANLKVLSRYVKLNALLAIIAAIIGLWALQLVFSYLSELDSLDDSYTMGQALKYIFYRSPYFLEQFIPTGALLGAVIGLGLLANKSELVVMHDSANADVTVNGVDVYGNPYTVNEFNHVPGWGNVLFMDGHVEFMRYPGEFPICASWSMLFAQVRNLI